MIKLNKHFLKSSIAVQKSAREMGRDDVAAIFVEDVKENGNMWRKYYCTDGVVLLFYKEKIEEIQIDGVAHFNFEKLPATKLIWYNIEIDNETQVASIETERGDFYVGYGDKDHTFVDKFEQIKNILEEEKIDSFNDATEFIIFSDTVLKKVKDYIGIGFYTMRPSVRNENDQKSSEVFWHNPENTMIAVAMPMRLSERYKI